MLPESKVKLDLLVLLVTLVILDQLARSDLRDLPERTAQREILDQRETRASKESPPLAHPACKDLLVHLDQLERQERVLQDHQDLKVSKDILEMQEAQENAAQQETEDHRECKERRDLLVLPACAPIK